MAKRVTVLLPRAFCEGERSVPAALREVGLDVLEGNPSDGPLPAEEVAALAHECDVLVVGADPVQEAAFMGNVRLKGVFKHGAGLDNIDLDAARRHGVPVAYAPGVNATGVGDLAVAFMLILARDLIETSQATRAGHWILAIGCELAGKNLGLIGFGKIGRQVAKRALAFDMTVQYYDIVDTPGAADLADVSRADGLDVLLATSDFVSLHLPLNAGTKGLLDKQALSRMRQGSYLINTSRGGIVDEAALAELLRAGRIGGAAFDVFEHEPPGSPLIGLRNVIATPHIGGATDGAKARLIDIALKSVAAMLDGESPPHPAPSGP